MSDFNFEGDISSLSESQLKFVCDTLKERGFTNEKVIVGPVGKPGDNYGATVKRFTVQKGEETFRMIAKIAPTNPIFRSMRPAPVLYKNEHILYTQLLPKFAELEIAADIPPNERLRSPACYGTYLEEPNEIILLEDLDTSDFVMLDKTKPLTNETIKLTLKNFAMLHSLSYVLKNQEPEVYESCKNEMVNLWTMMSGVEQMIQFFSQIEEGILVILDNDKYKKLTKGTMSRLAGQIQKNAKYDGQSKYSVIQHGDAWTNNLMFRLENGTPVECCMIDYQQSNHNTPAADLHYMIFNCTDYETRFQHYHDWIDYYHSELDKRLSNFGLKSSLIFPRDQLDTDMRRFAKISFAFSLMMTSQLLMATPEAAIEMQAAIEQDVGEMVKVANQTLQHSTAKNAVKDRVDGLIASFIDLGYL